MTGAQHKVVGVGFGIAGTYALCHGYNEPWGTALLIGSTIGCMLPDIDHDRTKIGRKRKAVTDLTSKLTKFGICGGIIVTLGLLTATYLGLLDYDISVSNLLVILAAFFAVSIIGKTVCNSSTYGWATKHRGLMHTLVVPAIIAAALVVTTLPIYRYTVIGIDVGYVSHLFADMLTVEGCPILFPITKKNFRILKLRTKDSSCTVAAWVVAIAVVALAIYMF